jgi:hypothetical protein
MATQIILNVNSNSSYAQYNGKSFTVLKEYANGKCIDIDLNGKDTQFSISEVIFEGNIVKQPKMTPAQKKVYDCLLAGNTINFHGESNHKFTASNGQSFSYSLVDKMIDADILKVKRERLEGIAATFKTIVIA